MKEFFFVGPKNDLAQIYFHDILYVQIARPYLQFVTIHGKYTCDGSLAGVEALLPNDSFCRVHRSHIVSLAHTKRITSDKVFVGSDKLPVGKQYRAALLERLTILQHDTVFTKRQIKDLFKRPPDDDGQ